MQLNFMLLMVVLLFIGMAPMVYAEYVPSWVKNTAGWGATEAISETAFCYAFVCLINDPRSFTDYNKTYTVEYLGNVAGGNIIRYLNLENEDLKKYTIKSIKADDPVWFGCDVGKFFSRRYGVMDMNMYEFDRFYGTTFGMSKAERLEYGDSVMTHAMLFTGVDLKNNKPVKWRVENSWGAEHGEKGFDIMTDPWFDQFMYEVVVHKKHLTKKLIDLYNTEPIGLPPWDPMGSLAK